MPFPLAHPSAVLPLRPYCPRWFNFPALVIGSLTPDAGYCFGPHMAKFSHRLVAGSFGFCLPVGLLSTLLFYQVRRLIIRRLPSRERHVFEPLCSRPSGSLFVMGISLLIGAWTHVFLDSFTHGDGWLVNQLAILQTEITVGELRLQTYDLLYSISTFAGVGWLAWEYLAWLERSVKASSWILPGFKGSAAISLATLALLLSLANHNSASGLMLTDIIVLSAALVAAFFIFTAWALRAGPTGEREIQPQPHARRSDG